VKKFNVITALVCWKVNGSTYWVTYQQEMGANLNHFLRLYWHEEYELVHRVYVNLLKKVPHGKGRKYSKIPIVQDR